MTEATRVAIARKHGDTRHEVIETFKDGGEIHHFINRGGQEYMAVYDPDGFEAGSMHINDEYPYDKVKRGLKRHYDLYHKGEAWR